MQRIKRPSSVPKSDQSRHCKHACEQTKNGHPIQSLLPRNNNKPANSENFKINSPSKSKMYKVNAIDLEFIFKKRGQFPETNRFRSERNRILQPNKTKIVGRGRDNERLQEYRPSQKGRKEIERINSESNGSIERIVRQ